MSRIEFLLEQRDGMKNNLNAAKSLLTTRGPALLSKVQGLWSLECQWKAQIKNKVSLKKKKGFQLKNAFMKMNIFFKWD